MPIPERPPSRRRVLPARRPRVVSVRAALSLIALAACGARSTAPSPSASEAPSGGVAASSAPASSAAPAPAAKPGEDLAHGRYLATIGACLECHTPRVAGDPERLDETRLMSGGTPFGGPWGVVHTANVSAVAAAYRPEHLEAAIRGQLSYKFQMPTELYAAYAADDMRDLVAFLRSLTPVDVPPPTNVLRTGYRPPPPHRPDTVLATAPKGATAERGAYLVQIAICKDCHSPRAADGVAYDEARLMSGGGIGVKVGGAWLVPPNLTPDRETGLGAWTDDEILAAFRTGVRKDGRRLHPVMPAKVAYADMTDEDARAIVAYLRALPPIRARRPPNGPYADPGAIDCCFAPPAPEVTP